jgi:hypothetical protein
MYDANPSKRCIHCALTDKPGLKGKIGTISSDLLSLLFPDDRVAENDQRLISDTEKNSNER